MTRSAVLSRALSVLIGVITLMPVSPALGQDNQRRANDVINSINASLGVLEFSGLPETLDVAADHLDYDYISGRILFRGNVVVTQGEVRLQASELKVVSITSNGRTIRRITAYGDVSVTNGQATAHGQTAIYDQGDGMITLRGGARLASDNKTVTGEKVIFLLEQGRARIERGEAPVRAVIETGGRNKDGVATENSEEDQE